ncbi:uncharacterized protein V1518DRAFT_417983 [Limtongia smithiae]|uniref:uncharacterized protein n=1 Tax=Limtongia smithiae TaxID=1125753 RepID=UPI0034CE8DFF
MDAGGAVTPSTKLSPTAGRLLLLADSTLVSVLERNRLTSLDLEPSAAEEADIQRNLVALKNGIAALEREQSLAENDSALSTRSLRTREDTLIRLQKQFDKLLTLLQDGGGSGDALVARVASTPSPRPSLVNHSSDYSASRGSLLNANSPRPKTQKTVRFSDNLVQATPDPLSIAADEARNSVSNTEALVMQQRIMQEQDDSLDRLSESISRQRELSIQIGDELDSHIELLGEVDRLVDWGQHRLDGARKRLDHVSRKAKENSSLVAIIVLIMVLLILIVILKCKSCIIVFDLPTAITNTAPAEIIILTSITSSLVLISFSFLRLTTGSVWNGRRSNLGFRSYMYSLVWCSFQPATLSIIILISVFCDYC